MDNIETKIIARAGRSTASEKGKRRSRKLVGHSSDTAVRRDNELAQRPWSSRRCPHPASVRGVGRDVILLRHQSVGVETAHLQNDNEVSVAIDLGQVHFVVDGVAERLTTADDMHRASASMLDVFGWPTEVRGDELDAPYAAPTSGGPPFQAWELRPTHAYAFPTRDQVEPTRFVFRVS